MSKRKQRTAPCFKINKLKCQNIRKPKTRVVSKPATQNLKVSGLLIRKPVTKRSKKWYLSCRASSQKGRPCKLVSTKHRLRDVRKI